MYFVWYVNPSDSSAQCSLKCGTLEEVKVVARVLRANAFEVTMVLDEYGNFVPNT